VKRPEVADVGSAAAGVRMARVRADEETWATFRALAGARPISEVLGQLVLEEVRRYRSRQLRDGSLQPRELLDALERAREQQADLELVVLRLEALTRVSDDARTVRPTPDSG